MRWEDADGNLAPNPPAKPIFRVGATAGGEFGTDANDGVWPSKDDMDADLSTASVDADNGLGDQAQDTNQSSYPDYPSEGVSKLSSGWHLKPEDGSSGKVTITVSGSAHAYGQHVSSGVCDWASAGGDVWPVQPLGQFMITSTIDESRHYGTATVPDRYDDVTLNKRDPSDYTITGDSVAYWNDLHGCWVGSATFSAANIGFDNPTWAWDAGGDVLWQFGNYIAPQVEFHYSLGSTRGGQTLGQTTTAKCTLTDSSGVTTDNTYKVNWHYPLENWSADGGEIELAPTLCGSGEEHPAGGTINVSCVENRVNWGTPLNKAGEGVMVGAHVIDVVGTALGAEVNPMLLVFLLGSGYTMTVVEQEPAETEPCTGDAGQLSSDVATQTSIDNGETSGVFLPNDSRMDANLAQRIHDSGDYTGYCNGTHGGALKFTASVYQHNFHQDYKGDAYGDHGYIGDGRVFFEQARGISKVFHWTFTEVGHP